MATYNPFNPNSTVTPTLFAGRSEQTLQIVRKLAQVKRGMSSNFIFHGERGIGKTALARLIRYLSESNNPDLENLNFLEENLTKSRTTICFDKDCENYG